MKKFILAVATIVTLSTASFAESGSESTNARDARRLQFLQMTEQMIDGEMQMLKMREVMLTNYKRILLQMMQNENSSNNN